MNFISRRHPRIALVALLASCAGVHAQTWPSYSAQKLATPTGVFNSDIHVTAINNKGVVSGWMAKPAGEITFYTARNGLPIAFAPFGPWEKHTTQAYELHPLTWTGGQVKTLPRVSGLYNTIATGVADDGTVLMEVSNTSGRSSKMWFDMTSPRHVRLYQGSTFKIPLIDGKRIAPDVNATQTFLAPNGQLLVRFNGQQRLWTKGVVSTFAWTGASPAGDPIKSSWAQGAFSDGRFWGQTYSEHTVAGAPIAQPDITCGRGLSGKFEVLGQVGAPGDFECLAMNLAGDFLAEAMKWTYAIDADGVGRFSSEAAGYYTNKAGIWTKLPLPAGALMGYRRALPAFMDAQGRLVASVYMENSSGNAAVDAQFAGVLLIQNGVIRQLRELVSPAFADTDGIYLVAANEAGQLLVQVQKPDRFEHYVLTPN